jgi:transposase InsO family protein
MQIPSNVKDLQRFLGYLSKFVSRLSELALPLQNLLHADTAWTWDSIHQRAFDNLKAAISSAPALQFYDVHKPVTLSCDASFGGLGAACLQDGLPVAYTSRSLTKAEQSYAQIEKELLAVTFACNKFHDYIIGKQVIVETDHKPLETIMKKPLLSAPMRLQRMMLQLQRYDLSLVYKKGSQLFIADTLSRAYLNETFPADIYEDYEILTVQPVASHKLDELQRKTALDPMMMQLASTILHGWPESQKDVPDDLKPYFNVRDQLATRDGVIYKGEKVVVPKSLQSDYLSCIHMGHTGVESTKRRARDILFWPGMNEDIEKFVRACSVCNSCKPHQQREPMKMHDVPERPWSLVATDLFQWNGTDYMVATDSFSGWFEINELNSTSSRIVIEKLKEHFARFGVPDVLYSDNGPQYSSEEFRKFSREWGFHHVTSSPYYAQSNGLAERAVRSAKELLEKCKKDGTDINLALLNQRNTPRDEVLGSPAQRLMSRRLKSTIPCSDKLLKRQQSNDSLVKDRLNEKRQQQKRFYDKQAKSLLALDNGDVVRMQTSKGYDKLGFVVRAEEQPRSFVVKSQGQEYRRNRRHLLKVPEQNNEVVEQNPVSTEEPSNTEEQKTVNLDKYPNVVVTKSGRISKPNPKYKDYVK